MKSSTKRLAFLVLAAMFAALAAAAPASAQATAMTVTGSADATTNNPALVSEPTTTPLHAVLANAPMASPYYYPQGPNWVWSIQSATLNSQAAPPGSYIGWAAPPAANGDSTLDATFYQPGDWVLTLLVTATYTPSSPNTTASATVNVSLAVLQITLSPNPVIVPVGGMAELTAAASSQVSSSDVTIAADDPGVATADGSMPTFWATGVQPGTTMCFCYYRGRQCSPGVPIYCWGANLQMPGPTGLLTGPAKLNPGGFVPLNANNDNGSVVTNGVPATRDFDVSPNPNEKDLVQIVLDATGLPLNTPLTWTLSAPTNGHAVVKAWTSSTKTAQFGLPFSMPGTAGSDPNIYLEGTAEGYALMEIALTLQVTVGGVTATDVVNVTVTPVLQNLGVTVTAGTTPTYGLETDGHYYLEFNIGVKPKDAFNLSAQAYITGIDSKGQLSFVQNTKNKNNLNDPVKGAVGVVFNDNTPGQAHDFGVVNGVNYAGKTLLDSDPTVTPPTIYFNGTTHNVAMANGTQTVTDADTPLISGDPIKPHTLPGIPPQVVAATLDTEEDFALYAVWKYNDGSFYVLGKTSWSLRCKGSIATDPVTKNYTLTPDATLNKNNPSTSFTRGNDNQAVLSPPVAGNANAGWR